VGHVPMPGSAMRAARISRSAAVPSCGVLSIVEQQEEAQRPYSDSASAVPTVTNGHGHL
jgi:hypothetical protein